VGNLEPRNSIDLAVFIQQTGNNECVGKGSAGSGRFGPCGRCGCFIGWMKSRDDIKPLAVPPLANQSMAEVAPVAMATVPTTPVAHTNFHRVQEAKPVVAPPSTEESGDWEKQLDDVLLADTDANTKADRILALIPTAPTNAQVELSQHLVNMVQDDHYDGAAQLLTNPATPPPSRRC
jgi:hypothetical protein